MKNYYAILNLTHSASKEEIKRSFRRLALLWHPDRHDKYKKALAHRKFVEIVEAYELLSDDGKRREYDAVFPYYKAKRASAGGPKPPAASDFYEFLKQARRLAEKYASEPLSLFTKRIKSAAKPVIGLGRSIWRVFVWAITIVLLYGISVYAALVVVLTSWYISPFLFILAVILIAKILQYLFPSYRAIAHRLYPWTGNTEKDQDFFDDPL